MNKEMADNLLSLVKRNYNEIAADFDASRKKEIWPEIREFAAAVKDGNRILDVGCGNGRLLEALKDKKLKYLGIDNSEELIKLARKNYPERKFLIGDILKLDSITESDFDHIFCLAVLQHIPGKELRVEALKQMVAKLKPSGELIISVWNLWRSPKHRLLLFKNYWLKILGKNKWEFNDLLFPWKNSRGQELSQRYYHAFTKKELKRLVHLAGLKIQKFIGDKYNYWFVLKNKFMSKTLEVNKNNFQLEVLNSQQPVLVDFWAPWCGPCQIMSPILDELAVEMAGKLKIAKVNTEEANNQDLAAEYQIQSIPNLKLFKSGKVIGEFIGLRNKESLIGEIEELIKQSNEK